MATDKTFHECFVLKIFTYRMNDKRVVAVLKMLTHRIQTLDSFRMSKMRKFNEQKTMTKIVSD